ncbi:hypothetical protein HK101_009810 [Irineochytrium annulatum]|nr:hypothetical protein HK101_009810 [Irineochytrium annulatum]
MRLALSGAQPLLTSDLISIFLAPHSPVTIPAISATDPIVVECRVESDEEYKLCTRHAERERKRDAREKARPQKKLNFASATTPPTTRRPFGYGAMQT